MTEIDTWSLIAEPGKQEVTISRVFDAPRDLVFATLTDPKQLPLWWGPRYLTTRVDVMDVRPGGAWRFVQTAPDGGEHAFHGYYHQVDPPGRIVQTFEYEGEPGHVVLETQVLEDLGNRTRMTVTSVFQTLADRDAMVASGMESGAREGWDRLAELLAEQD